ncbi:serine/threonine protein kinase [Actinomycetospora endophytica]|uniref:non-specific serine/threonine protein kinase n=1 Tax=Actinomycetospora endophytica TaxID=2291215 RepID=A0ABS8P4P2_9PSEU|nr:serine/threonine-protein kinase [Actinomycetospora endophytica]MCD2193227.1 serine/threonine protein kinase [Actinomycetospora endophytica]
MSSTEPVPPSTVGAGRYTLGDLIGRGGAAEVFRARDELLGRDVAVKLFPAGVGEADESRRQREVQTLAGMNHPGLVTIYDVGAEGSRAYFVMQLIEGESLADRIRSGPLRLGDVVALGAALADALTYVHRHGVVHRDIKPGNVLLDTEGRPHLSDFGIAVLADATNITATGMVIGTASYLSPEQVRGQPVGPASDVYALGLVLLECITARREYPGNALEAAVARLHRPPDIPPDLPPALGGLLVAMTRDEPAERPTTEQVVGELRMIAREVGMDAETVLAPAPTTGSNAMRTSAMGPPGTAGTGATYAMNPGTPPGAYDPYGATQRVGTPPGGYQPYGQDGRTALVGPGTATGAPVAEEPVRRRKRWPMIVALIAVLLVAAGVGAYALLGNSTANTPAPVPTVAPPAPATTTTTTTEERTTTRSRRTTTEAPTTTQAPPPPVTTTVVPPPSTAPSTQDTGTSTTDQNQQNGGVGLFPQNNGFSNGGANQTTTPANGGG